MENNQNLKQLKQYANTLPLTPGVYIMRDKKDKIIYVGKAKALKNRVTQYFGSNTNHSLKVRQMVSNVDRFEYILCDSEFEALILENSLIKQHQPKYNILLKDDKGYHYIKVTNEKWSRISWVKSKENDSAKYIGPYNSGFVVKNTVDEALKIFKLPVCNRNFEKPSKPCLNFHIGICSAPCRGKLTIDEYNEQVEGALGFIKKGGYSAADLAALTKKMENAAENLDFEYAARLRDRIKAVEKIAEKQKVISTTYPKQDIFAIVSVGDTSVIQMLAFRNGRLNNQDHLIIEGTNDKEEIYNAFLPQYYQSGEDIPPRVVLDTDLESALLLEQFLSEKALKKVNISVPKIGEQKRLIEMCRSNAAEILSKRLERTGRETVALNELGELLGLSEAPRYIESYDISNTAGSENVASMVVFYDGRPLKSAYRKFKIKGFLGQDDYRSMAEVLDRRFEEYKKGTDEAFSRLPDLILLDGGKGQISAVLPVLKKHGISVPIFGMVKDSKHRTRAIASKDGDIALKPTRKAFSLVTQIQDETHRVAISFHKKRRSSSMVASELLNIEGVGKNRANALLKHFKSFSKIKAATIDELLRVKGITTAVATKIYDYFHK